MNTIRTDRGEVTAARRGLALMTLLAGTLLLPGFAPAAAAGATEVATLKVLASMPAYGALATAIGGEQVEVTVLCRPGQDMHGVTATPSLVARVRSADLLFHTGLDAELWLGPLLRSSGNLQLLPGNPRSVELSAGIALLDVPQRVDRSQGDVHAFGNPHVWTDPLAVRIMAGHVLAALVAAAPEHADGFRERHRVFHERLTDAVLDWLVRFKELKGKPVAVYHRSWSYFLRRFGIEEVAALEPKPRVAPTAGHLASTLEVMRERDAKVVIREPWCAPDAAEFVAREVGGRVVDLSTHPGWPDGTGDILEHFEHNLSVLAEALGVSVPPRS